MKGTVLWVPSAEQELVAIWLEHGDRDRVTAAADEIDRRLRRDPENQGESREEGLRILLVAPLGVDFEIRAEDRKVQVLSVWTFTVGGNGPAPNPAERRS